MRKHPVNEAIAAHIAMGWKVRESEAGDSYSNATARDDAVIAEALAITERRLLARQGASLTSPRACADYLKLHLTPHMNERFVVVFLNTRHRVIAVETLFQGTVDGASVHPRVVVTRALHHNAAAVILAHNHPSGDPQPSQADIALTRRLSDSLGLVDVRVLDHFIVGIGEPLSLAERGLM